ncbi:MAG TPA: phosphatase PAP2 family protein [Anaeromyxobacteraceae bacterium]|nr:phosphatase PAP2 family protein [Anaeromyxobacteraceae bacterium]
MRVTIRRVMAVAVLLVLASPARSAELPDSLSVSFPVDGAITGAAILVAGVGEFASPVLGPLHCRWCDPPGVDASVHGALVWGNAALASTGSDVLFVTLPAAVVAYDFLAARGKGSDLGRIEEDVLVIVESVAVATVAAEMAKYATARERPEAYYGHPTSRDANLSFVSTHAVVTFAAAAAGGEVARMRGYPGWPFVYAAGFAGAAFTGYLRLAGNQHWLSDVLAGAALGTGSGLLVPWLHRGPGDRGTLHLVPMPSGLAVAGTF